MVLNRNNLNAALLLALYLSYYLEVSLYIGGADVFPFFGCFCVASVSFAFNARAEGWGWVQPYMIIVGIAFFSLIVGLSLADTFTKRLGSTLQFASAIYIGISIVFISKGMRPEAFGRFFFFVAVVITILAAAERIEIVKTISDEVRSAIYPPDLIYTGADDRDLLLYGAVRPKVFTREPSLVGIHCGLAFAVSFLLARNRLKAANILRYSTLAVAALYFIRSPTLLFFYAASMLGAIALPPIEKRSRTLLLGRYIALGVIPIIFILPSIVLLTVPESGASSSSGGLSLEDIVYGPSFYLRLIGPFKVFLYMVSEHPFFGYSIGASESLRNAVETTYAGIETYVLDNNLIYDYSRPDYLISNAFFHYWIIFGLVGGVALASALALLLRAIAVRHLLFVFVVSSLCLQTLGGITALWPSFIFFMFAAASAGVSRIGAEHGERQ